MSLIDFKGVIFINVVKIVLKVKSPAMDMDELDFTEKKDDIFESVNIFNDKFRDWSKRIIITNLTKRAMHLLMVLEKANVADNLSVREIRSFIQYLRNEKEWNKYTREKNKMFETVEFYRLDKDMLIHAIEKVKANQELYDAQKHDIDFMCNQETMNVIEDTKALQMDDDDMITVLDYLIKTKDKGNKKEEKAEDLEKIKLILSKWL